MSDWAVVTGGGTGIGRALAHTLAEQDVDVLIVGRRQAPLEQTRAADSRHIHCLAADVSSEQGRAAIAAALPATARLRYLVHNAGVLTPIGPLSEVKLDQWRQSQAINVEGPLFLTQALLQRLSGGRVLHVSSGAAHHGYRGWGAYCASKAALHMIYLVLREELQAQGIAVGSMRPGVVDTPMQDLIREQTPERFPAVGRFMTLKEQGALVEPAQVAAFMAWLLQRCPAEEFSALEWEFTNAAHRARWQTDIE